MRAKERKSVKRKKNHKKKNIMAGGKNDWVWSNVWLSAILKVSPFCLVLETVFLSLFD